MWFGAVSAKYPELVGSLGELTGLLAVGWGVAVAVAPMGHRAVGHPGARTGSEVTHANPPGSSRPTHNLFAVAHL
jgi:hypothetical protein